ncbi:MAG: patatin-like phospholipase family protein [Gammaproteobacteria bacterium]|nr:patatin-like phospholipase family protein [Gammaproteobacteria bacterium]
MMALPQKIFVAVCTLALGACAHYPVNERLVSLAPDEGYRFTNLDASDEADSLFVILTFSGGGTRAAAFSYGVMERLAAETIMVNGKAKRLLDEVDVISSVSGGSFTAAYYGLFGDALFEEFKNRFLYRNVQSALILRILNPLNWFQLASSTYDRIDLAAEYYDKTIFDRQRYSRLVESGRRPFIILNATDIGTGSRFEFTQSQFDWLYSDLSQFGVARAVAASSAFPGLLSPVRIRNYENPPAAGGEDEPQFKGEPQWLEEAINDADRVDPRFFRAREIATYTRDPNRPFIHLMDGGLTDNIGLRGPLWAMQSNDSSWSLLDRMNNGKIDTLLVISVDAKPVTRSAINTRENAPGLIKVLGAVTSTPLENLSGDTVLDFHTSFDQWRKDQLAAEDAGMEVQKVDYYDVHIGFEEVVDPELRDKVSSLPTSFHLKRDQVDALREAADDALTNSVRFKEFLEAMK